MESSAPPVPVVPPPIHRGKMWVTLAAPTVVAVLCNLCIGLSGKKDAYGAHYLGALPFIGIAILIGVFCFYAVIRKRYRGRSIGLLIFGYLLGQIGICVAVWFGTCLLALEMT